MMSKAYWIVRVSVRDEENYPKYLAAARLAFEKFGANFIVRGGAFESMEGTPRDRNVVVEFKDRATAMAATKARIPGREISVRNTPTPISSLSMASPRSPRVHGCSFRHETHPDRHARA